MRGYERLSASLAPSAAELVYVHVPLQEYAKSRIIAGTCALFAARVRAGMLPRPWWLPACVWRWAPLLAPLLGLDRAVGCSTVNTGLVRALSRRAVVRAVSCGHNHYNDYVGVYGSLYLCFGRLSGISPPTTWEHDGGELPFSPGGRVIAVQPASHGEAPGMAAGHTADARVITWVQTAAGVEDRIELPGKRAGALWAARGHAMALGVAAVVLAAAWTMRTR